MGLIRVREEDGNLTTQRIEAFSDGIFAIAITLLILEIRVHPEPAKSLFASLMSVWPSYFAYILSFITIGIYWVNHHYIFQIYQRTNHTFNLLNVFFLMCISFLPFPTGILGGHLLDIDEQRTTIAVYILGLLLPATGWFLSWMYASHNYRLIDTRLCPEFVNYLTRKYGFSIVLYTLAFLAAFVVPLVGMAIAVGLTMLYLLPSKQPVYLDSPVE